MPTRSEFVHWTTTLLGSALVAREESRAEDVQSPATTARHDHGGLYLWGKEKLIDRPNEHPVLTTFKKQYYAGNSIAAELARQGYVVVVIDMFYWGERRLLLDDDAADWRQRPASI